MSEIALYNLFKRIPDTTDAEAQEAAADVANAKEVATKADIKDMATKADIKELKSETKVDIAEVKIEISELETKIIEKIANQEAKLTKLIYMVVGVNTTVIIASVGLMIKFL